MDVGDVIKTGLDNGEHVECVVLLTKAHKQKCEKRLGMMDNR